MLYCFDYWRIVLSTPYNRHANAKDTLQKCHTYTSSVAGQKMHKFNKNSLRLIREYILGEIWH